VLAPLAGLETFALAGTEPDGLVVTAPDVVEGTFLTVAVVGALTDADAPADGALADALTDGALPDVFTDTLTEGGLPDPGGVTGGTCANAGCATPTHNNTVRDRHRDRFAKECIRSTSRAGGCHSDARHTPRAVTRERRSVCPTHAFRYACRNRASLERDPRLRGVDDR
jgi:hypothetical protein